MKCHLCKERNAAIKRSKNGQAVCKECFFYVFEEEVHYTIVSNNLFKPGEKVGIGASGGKDSTVLAHVLTTLNERYSYGLELFLLSVDEGITGYRDDSLKTVELNKDFYKLPLLVISYKEIYGWTMDDIVKLVGLNNNCTFCGVFRRQALDRGAFKLGVDKICTGHNADDIAETVLMNILRGDFFRLSKCHKIITGEDDIMPRCKPLKYCYEKEIVMYAHLKKLDYFSTECSYAPQAYRGYVRELLKDMERVRPSAIVDIIHSAELMKLDADVKIPPRMNCSSCGFISSNKICKACVLLDGLNKGRPKIAMSRKAVIAYEHEQKKENDAKDEEIALKAAQDADLQTEKNQEESKQNVIEDKF
uniref:Cytoplasmic tRNA 2-thiolation protein 1 n=1 Tax=Euplotes harpa TaxID=151035 RepID=A0A7S3JIF8_9SPIT|mmetsp:Transcript_37763/g.43403  ORF Transcript_37763/g.43403 Transcript_37763/m.43403 type:complete len:362 (+) Transcript_37763:17-1102(+)